MSKVQEKRAGRPSRRLSAINTAAAGIDIGETLHVVGVGEERCERPMRSFSDLYVEPPRVGELAY